MVANRQNNSNFSYFGGFLTRFPMLKLTQSHQSNHIGAKQVEARAKTCQESLSFVLALNDHCPMVRAFGKLVRRWDRDKKFTFVDVDSPEHRAGELLKDLACSPWSVLLVDKSGTKWFGPEAVPIILTHLPFGKVAAVLYILPGTMWATRKAYRLFSGNKRLFPGTGRTA